MVANGNDKQLCAQEKESVTQVVNTLIEEHEALRDHTKNPLAIFTGGISGSGKSSIVEKHLKPAYTNALLIDADTLRKHHPHYQSYAKLVAQGKMTSCDLRDNTRLFCDEVAAQLFELALKKGISFIKDGTLELKEQCTKEIIKSSMKGHDVRIVLVSSQRGDNILLRHLRYWKTKGESFERELQASYNDEKSYSGILFVLGLVQYYFGQRSSAPDAKSKRSHHALILNKDGQLVEHKKSTRYNKRFKKLNLCSVKLELESVDGSKIVIDDNGDINISSNDNVLQPYDPTHPEHQDRFYTASSLISGESLQQYYQEEYERERTPEEQARISSLIDEVKSLMSKKGASEKKIKLFDELCSKNYPFYQEKSAKENALNDKCENIIDFENIFNTQHARH